MASEPGVPAEHSCVGVVSFGHRTADVPVTGYPTRRVRRQVSDAVHHDRCDLVEPDLTGTDLVEVVATSRLVSVTEAKA